MSSSDIVSRSSLLPAQRKYEFSRAHFVFGVEQVGIDRITEEPITRDFFLGDLQSDGTREKVESVYLAHAFPSFETAQTVCVGLGWGTPLKVSDAFALGFGEQFVRLEDSCTPARTIGRELGL